MQKVENQRLSGNVDQTMIKLSVVLTFAATQPAGTTIFIAANLPIYPV